MGKEIMKLGKKEIEYDLVYLNQADLKFYTENPRVYSILNITGDDPTQEEIEEELTKMEHVKQLRLSIESNGGLLDPLIVRGGDNTVLEGNSRLAAYRILCEKDPVTWGKVQCKVLPSDIDDDAIFALLGSYHIIGRKDWEPFEQAHYLYRRKQKTKMPVEAMTKELGLTKDKGKKMVKVIEFMINHDDLNKRKWSYYEEYLKNASIKKFRDTNPDLDETIAEEIKTGQIKEASDIRKIGEIAKVGDKQSKKLMKNIAEGSVSIYDAYENMKDAGKLEDVVKKLNTFRKYVNSKDFEKQVENSKENAAFEIKKIVKELQRIQKKYDLKS